MTAACGYPTRRGGQCRLPGNTVVPGVEDLLCRQHARMVATEPGAAGVVRQAPVGVDGIVAELGQATTVADITRCRSAIAHQIDVCSDQTGGLRRELVDALQAARARIKHGGAAWAST